MADHALPARTAALLDVAAVAVFVVLGRSSHGEGVDVAGTATTAWPFLGGLALGWLLGRAWRRPERLLPTGVVVWVVTLVVGMVLRVVTGGGTTVSFVVVAGVVLAALLLGWRGLALLVTRH